MSELQSRPASLADFLAQLAPSDPRDWADSLRDDQRNRWHAGERVRVEDYLRWLPGLCDQTDAVLDLVYGEVLLREAAGEKVNLRELQNRFPAHTDALARQWEVHQLLEDRALARDTHLGFSRPALCVLGRREDHGTDDGLRLPGPSGVPFRRRPRAGAWGAGHRRVRHP